VNEPVNIFRVVSFVHEIPFRRSVSVTLKEEFSGVNNIVNRMLQDLQTGNNLTLGIN
jgi:hypothetical protein